MDGYFFRGAGSAVGARKAMRDFVLKNPDWRICPAGEDMVLLKSVE